MSGWHHTADCRKSPSFPHCNCGYDETVAKLEQLEAAASQHDTDMREAFLAGVSYGEGWLSDETRESATGETAESAAEQYVLDKRGAR